MTPLQLVGMISTIANDGIWVAPRIVAGTTEPRGTPQMVAFHPGVQRRVISPMTAAQMKQMMQGVVLHGTGKKAILEGYSSAGKTGTAQKVDPATRAYSHTKYVASFAGFAPINDPAITVAVILDSAVGLHQGGQVSAPVFQRVTQQVLEYLHTPHDVELPPSRQVLLAERRVKDQDVEEGSPDRLATLWMHPIFRQLISGDQPVVASTASLAQRDRQRCRASGAMHQSEPAARPLRRKTKRQCRKKNQEQRLPIHLRSSGTAVVLDVEQGGIAVPSFLGKSIRARHRDGPGKRTGPGCGGQRLGSGTVSPARFARSVRLAGDGEVWPLNAIAAKGSTCILT